MYNESFNADPREAAFFRCLSNAFAPAKLVAKLVGGRVNSGALVVQMISF